MKISRYYVRGVHNFLSIFDTLIPFLKIGLIRKNVIPYQAIVNRGKKSLANIILYTTKFTLIKLIVQKVFAHNKI